MFSDSQIVMEQFLEDINNILNSGEVPNLFAKEDSDNIVNDLRAEAKKQTPPRESADEILAWFVIRCRQNLHICLTFSPVGDQF